MHDSVQFFFAKEMVGAKSVILFRHMRPESYSCVVCCGRALLLWLRIGYGLTISGIEVNMCLGSVLWTPVRAQSVCLHWHHCMRAVLSLWGLAPGTVWKFATKRSPPCWSADDWFASRLGCTLLLASVYSQCFAWFLPFHICEPSVSCLWPRPYSGLSWCCGLNQHGVCSGDLSCDWFAPMLRDTVRRAAAHEFCFRLPQQRVCADIGQGWSEETQGMWVALYLYGHRHLDIYRRLSSCTHVFSFHHGNVTLPRGAAIPGIPVAQSADEVAADQGFQCTAVPRPGQRPCHGRRCGRSMPVRHTVTDRHATGALKRVRGMFLLSSAHGRHAQGIRGPSLPSAALLSSRSVGGGKRFMHLCVKRGLLVMIGSGRICCL